MYTEQNTKFNALITSTKLKKKCNIRIPIKKLKIQLDIKTTQKMNKATNV